jgi:hypothetical protein
MLAENYDTMTNIQFQPYKTLDGTEELPAQVLGQKTAFTQNAYHHNAREADVKSQYIDTNIRAPYDVIPKYRTRLDRINEKDPIKSENYGHVSYLIRLKKNYQVINENINKQGT